MKLNSILPLICLSLLLTACSGGYNFNSESMDKLNHELKSRFGEEAWYTSVVIRDNDAGKNVITVDVTKDPNSLRQVQWVLRGEWEKSSDITLRIDGGKPEDYMFQLDKEVSFSRLNDLIQQSKEQLKEEEQVGNAKVKVASIIANSEMSNKLEGIVYTISLHDAVNDKSYSFVYNLNGDLMSFNK